MRRLQKLGVDRALVRAGARDGDEVRVGALTFTWYRDEGAVLDEADEDRRPSARRRRAPKRASP